MGELDIISLLELGSVPFLLLLCFVSFSLSALV